MISIFHRKNIIDHIAWLEVDIHNHLLPGIDDGAVDLEQSMHFIKAMATLGFGKFYCTPHIFTELYPNNTQTISMALNSVKVALARERSELEVYAAAEYMMDETFKVADNLLCLPGKHLLVEMSYLVEMPELEQLIFELQLQGFKVILAHPERYVFYHRQSVKYQRLKDMGVLFQLNLLSAAGYYGREVKLVATDLLKMGSYDFAGTDLHHAKQLALLQDLVRSGEMFRLIGHYPFKNKEVF